MYKEYSPIDDGPHVPPANAPASWQESFFAGWYDPSTRSAGFHHTGLQRVRGIADVWTWVAIDGAVVGKFQSLSLPMPDSDYGDLHLGGQRIVTREALRVHDITATYPSGASTEIRYEAFTPPFSYSLTQQGNELGSDHYESCGTVSGAVRSGDTIRRVTGAAAFQDHSWGPRDWSSVLAHRWVHAVFDENLFLSVMNFVTPKGRYHEGWVFQDGSFHAVQEVQINAVIADDGHSPRSCDTRITTVDDGPRLRVRGTVGVSSPSTHTGGYFVTDGFATFTLDGREAPGAGTIEVNNLAWPTAPMQDDLGLTPDESPLFPSPAAVTKS